MCDSVCMCSCVYVCVCADVIKGFVHMPPLPTCTSPQWQAPALGTEEVRGKMIDEDLELEER